MRNEKFHSKLNIVMLMEGYWSVITCSIISKCLNEAFTNGFSFSVSISTGSCVTLRLRLTFCLTVEVQKLLSFENIFSKKNFQCGLIQKVSGALNRALDSQKLVCNHLQMKLGLSRFSLSLLCFHVFNYLIRLFRHRWVSNKRPNWFSHWFNRTMQV